VENEPPIPPADSADGPERRSVRRRVVAIVVTAVVLAALAVIGLSKLHPSEVGRALGHVRAGWLVLAELLMIATFVCRGESWYVALRVALPDARLTRPVVTRVLMIGMAGSTLVPSRAGEAARAALIVRRVGAVRETLPRVIGTLLSQTLLNLLALALLSAVAIANGALPGSGSTELLLAVAVPGAIVAGIVLVPRVLLARAQSNRGGRWTRVVAGSLDRVRAGLEVFSHPRPAIHSGGFQLAAWACQAGSCLLTLWAMGLGHRADVAAAAAVLVAVNITAIVPLTPSNVGVFQAACIAVLARFGVHADAAFAYGIVLQGLEVLTALALGLPFALREGLSMRDLPTLP